MQRTRPDAGPIATVGTTAPRIGVEAARERDGYRPVLSLLASLFFMWGFITVLNSTLPPHLRSVFDLDYMQATLIGSGWVIAYSVASISAAKLTERIRYEAASVTGLGIMALGTLGITRIRIPYRPRRDRLGEGPVWLPERGVLFWVDIEAPTLNWLDLADGATGTRPFPEPLGWIIPRAGATSSSQRRAALQPATRRPLASCRSAIPSPTIWRIA